MQVKRIAVIGAGASGLTAIKACREEGLDVVCYEKTGSLGGLWRYREDVEEGAASVMSCTVMNSSREASAFSDFPLPEKFPLYMPHGLVYDYFIKYADKFSLRPFVKLGQEVVALSQENNGKWLLDVRDSDMNVLQELFDGVIICTGHQAFPKWPQVLGLESFKGQVCHSHGYRNANAFADKNVLVVGLGSSSADIATDLIGVAKNIYMSVRRGTWITPRAVQRGHPLDLERFRRASNAILGFLPSWLTCKLAEKEFRAVVDPKFFGIEPNYGPLQHEPLITDHLVSGLMTRQIVIKGPINRLNRDEVVLESGESLAIDAVIFATGYEFKFPFIKISSLLQQVISPENNQIGLYKGMFAPTMDIPESLAFIGLKQTLGALFPVFELQSRWAALLMSGKRKLPPKEDMLADIKLTHDMVEKSFVICKKGETCLYDAWIPYMDAVASAIGCKPNLVKYLFTDLALFRQLLFGPFSPVQYRLQGPHLWPEARTHILDIEERVKKAFM